jgi:hypothetical protein
VLRILTTAALFLLSLSSLPAAEVTRGCSAGAGEFNSKINNFTIAIKPHPDQKKFSSQCLLTVTSTDGIARFQEVDHGLDIDPISGRDISGDGQPDLVVVAYSGGAHCCWTYSIYSLGADPRLVTRIHNERDIAFIQRPEGHIIYLKTQDGRFDYFDGLCHACNVFPLVFLRLQGDSLKDASSEFWHDYQNEIDSAEKQLTPEAIAKFRSSDNHAPEESGTKAAVLSIVFAYLYGGKPDQAWEQLQKLWPPKDYDRIKALILKTRGDGFVNRQKM